MPASPAFEAPLERSPVIPTRGPRPSELANVGVLVATQLLQLALLLAVARGYGPAGLGTISLGLVAGTLVYSLAGSGLAGYGTRLVAAGELRPSTVFEIGLVRVALAGSIWLAVAAAAAILLPTSERSTVLLISVASVVLVAAPEWLPLGQGRMLAFAGLTFALRGLAPALATVAALRHQALAVLAAAYPAVAIVILAALLVRGRARIAAGLGQLRVAGTVRLGRDALSLGTGSMLNVLLFVGDALLVRALLGGEALGIYTAATKPVTAIASGVSIAAQAMLPRAVRERGTLRPALWFLGPPLLGVAGLLAIFAPEALRLGFGARYEAAGTGVLRVFALNLLLVAAGTLVLSLRVIPGRRDRGYLLAIAAGVATLAGLGIPLASAAGILGVALAATAAQGVVLVVAIWVGGRE